MLTIIYITDGQTDGNMKDSGEIIKCMVKDNSLGKTDGATVVNTSMISKK